MRRWETVLFENPHLRKVCAAAHPPPIPETSVSALLPRDMPERASHAQLAAPNHQGNTRRAPRCLSGPPDFRLYTDAATSARIISAAPFRPSRAPRIVTEARYSATPAYWRNLFTDANIIYFVEPCTRLAFIGLRADAFRGRPINIYMGDDCAIRALARCDNGSPIIADAVALFCKFYAPYFVSVLGARSPSVLNVADRRRDMPPLFPFRRPSIFTNPLNLTQRTNSASDVAPSVPTLC